MSKKLCKKLCGFLFWKNYQVVFLIGMNELLMITRKCVNFINHSVFQTLHENIRELNNVNKAIEIPTETDRNRPKFSVFA
jgi:hypothetical protein